MENPMTITGIVHAKAGTTIANPERYANAVFGNAWIGVTNMGDRMHFTATQAVLSVCETSSNIDFAVTV